MSLTACLACAGLVSTPARAGAAIAAPLSGVNIGGVYDGIPLATADREIAAAKALHAGVVRVAIPWSLFEPVGSGQIAQPPLAFTDHLVSVAAAAGIHVIMTVDSTPCWASSAPAKLLHRCAGGTPSYANAYPPRDPATYASFVAYLAQRYGTDLAAIEIWNEPDQANQLYFAGPNKPRRYAAVLRAAYPAIKQANPAVPVIAGSLVGSNGVFLRALYAAGIKGYYDGLAVHFYTLVLASLRTIHEVQLANGDTKPLWLDEFGWSSCYPRHRIQEEQACVTAHVQGRNLADVFHSLARTPYVVAKVSYDLRNSDGEDFGVLADWRRPKPAFSLLSRTLASPFGKVSPVTLSLRRRGGQVVASGSGPVGDFMQLEAFQGTVLRFRADFTLDRFDRYSITLPSVLGTHGLLLHVYQAWGGPGTGARDGI
jgi:hypothetical protein